VTLGAPASPAQQGTGLRTLVCAPSGAAAGSVARPSAVDALVAGEERGFTWLVRLAGSGRRYPAATVMQRRKVPS
jgi:hypothetical protein